MTTLKLASLACLVALAANTATAAAETADEPVERDPQTAFAISFGGTVASAALLGASYVAWEKNEKDASKVLGWTGAAGLLVAPTLGHVYGSGRFLTWGSGMRVAGVGLVALAIANFSLGDACLGECDRDYNSPRHDDGNAALVVVGAIGGPILFVSGIVHDIATAGRETEAANERRFNAHFTPTVMRGVTGPVAGLGIGGEF